MCQGNTGVHVSAVSLLYPHPAGDGWGAHRGSQSLRGCWRCGLGRGCPQQAGAPAPLGAVVLGAEAGCRASRSSVHGSRGARPAPLDCTPEGSIALTPLMSPFPLPPGPSSALTAEHQSLQGGEIHLEKSPATWASRRLFNIVSRLQPLNSPINPSYGDELFKAHQLLISKLLLNYGSGCIIDGGSIKICFLAWEQICLACVPRRGG